MTRVYQSIRIVKSLSEGTSWVKNSHSMAGTGQYPLVLELWSSVGTDLIVGQVDIGRAGPLGDHGLEQESRVANVILVPHLVSLLVTREHGILWSTE